jgi:hypothetical protein
LTILNTEKVWAGLTLRSNYRPKANSPGVDFDDLENAGQHIGIRTHKGRNRQLAGRVKNEQGPDHPAIGTVEKYGVDSGAA